MKGSKTNIAALAEKCKSILLSNWRGSLNTIHQDAKSSKDAIYTSKVQYVIKKKKPYLWAPESNWHNLQLRMRFLDSFACNLRNRCLRWNRTPFSHQFSSSTRPSLEGRAQLIDFLINQGFKRCQAVSLANHCNRRVRSLDRPRSVVQFFRSLGFSDSQIRSSIQAYQPILFCDVKKTLEPKIQFLEQLGFSGSALPHFIAKNSSLMTYSLERRLIPSTEILKTILLPYDKNNQKLVMIITRCSWLLTRDPNSFLLSNISYLKTCGIVGSQLAILLKVQPRLFISPENKLRVYVSRALDLGFSINSRMLVHAVTALSCLSPKTLDRKIQVFLDGGFTKDEIREMIRKAPGVIRCAKKKLMLGIEFYMKTMDFKRETLVKRPSLLMYSMEERVIPRFRVLEVLREKGLLKKMKKPSLTEMVGRTETDFVKRFIVRFGKEHAEALLTAYKPHLLDTHHFTSISLSSNPN